jgi:hypothetical protein
MLALAPVDKPLQFCEVFEAEFKELVEVDGTTFQPMNAIAYIEVIELMARVWETYPEGASAEERYVMV